ncbi:uncharacterized protein TNIN_134061 [Trichonephila inaurata madagascariensis]|uniref:Sperm microtubule inner protein 1 C-terminal domain-containing protein n=1 Tax=Trichonephila inaurata madagascariensis TaxID=2747483 RepID=A0A8X6WUX4_9ARAC|nr:uncharacterized protein TNIN_134061 [Trichonephila inaurata madagascariensis]
MEREKFLDPAFQKAFNEEINKDYRIRIQWHLKHDSSLRKTARESCGWDDAPDDDDEDFVAPYDLSPSAPLEVPEVGLLKLRRVEEPPEVDLEELKKIEEELKVMKPVHPKTKKIIYEGISKEDEGRRKYLKKRYKKNPEDKFYFPVCTSWEYGWTSDKNQSSIFQNSGASRLLKYPSLGQMMSY